MQKSIIAFILGASLSAGGLSLAAPGDLIIRHETQAVEVTAAQAATAADWYISRSAWDGDRADIARCGLWKVIDDGAAKFYAGCTGVKTIAPGSIPADSGELRVVGRVE